MDGLDGKKLKTLYLEDNFNSDLKTQENLMLLLMYQVEHMEEDSEKEEEIIDFCVKELDKLRPKDPEREQQLYNELVAKINGRTKKNRRAKKVLKAACVAGVFLCVTLTTQAVSQAVGKDFFQFVVDNINEQLNINIKKTLPVQKELHGLNWLPEGYTLEQEKVQETNQETNKIYLYKNGTKSFILNIKSFKDKDNTFINFKTEDRTKTYDYNGTTYYITENNENGGIVWYQANKVYSVSGNLSETDMKNIIHYNFGD